MCFGRPELYLDVIPRANYCSLAIILEDVNLSCYVFHLVICLNEKFLSDLNANRTLELSQQV